MNSIWPRYEKYWGQQRARWREPRLRNGPRGSADFSLAKFDEISHLRRILEKGKLKT